MDDLQEKIVGFWYDFNTLINYMMNEMDASKRKVALKLIST